MDLYLEQKLRDEVLYLHSLYHQSPISIHPTNLHPLNSTHFKKPKKKVPKFKHPKKVANFSGKEWPVKPTSGESPATQSGWPELKLKPKLTRVPTPQELEKYNWNQVQQKALNCTKDFYIKNFQDSDDDGDDDDDDMYDDDGDDDDVEGKGYDFFWELFNGDEELKKYYATHCSGGGEFICLVCGSANEKKQKRFKDCIALVQHSISIAKTKKKISHRVYGKVICKVLGWDIDRLPSSIVSDYKASELKGNDGKIDEDLKKVVESRDSVGNGHDVGENVDGESMICEESSVVANVEEENTGTKVSDKTEGNTAGVVNNVAESRDSNGNGHDAGEHVGESMVCEESSVVANVEENTGKKVSDETEGNTGGVVNNLCRNLSSTMVLEATPAT
uniref:uncharacterized protein LOC122602326 isoform X2 n=1 Tax=Erigeron canadensis TaxID=72917 RepID=UPI001CB95ADE|nr:uncharacterized protein LOC122602326 isoform X2 [Erigeron canadensis]